MDFNDVSECLNGDRFGLFFLAGVDDGAGTQGHNLLTIHAAQGAISPENDVCIRKCLSKLDTTYEVQIRTHAPDELYSPDSLEAFARLFEHDHIVSDPTGAFSRVNELTDLAYKIRAQFGSAVDRIVWQAETSRLYVQLNKGDDAGLKERLVKELKLLEADMAGNDLATIVAAIEVCSTTPDGKCTAVDIASVRVSPQIVVSNKKRGFARVLARISGIAALIGFGAVSAAGAATPAISKPDYANMPGITALVGLTTLGENSYGLRNPYQAVGGLRLYFGDAGTQMASAFSPSRLLSPDFDASVGDDRPVPVLYSS